MNSITRVKKDPFECEEKIVGAKKTLFKIEFDNEAIFLRYELKESIKLYE